MRESGNIRARAVPSTHPAVVVGLDLQHRQTNGMDNVETHLRYILPLDGGAVVGVVGSVYAAKRDGGTGLRQSPAEFETQVAVTGV